MKHLSLALLALSLAACNQAPTTESFTTPSGGTAHKIYCADDTNQCYGQAKAACSGGTYQVLDSASRKDPYRVNYSMTVACGKSDGKLASFPSKDPPPSAGNTTTHCFNGGAGVVCNSW